MLYMTTKIIIKVKGIRGSCAVFKGGESIVIKFEITREEYLWKKYV